MTETQVNETSTEGHVTHPRDQPKGPTHLLFLLWNYKHAVALCYYTFRSVDETLLLLLPLPLPLLLLPLHQHHLAGRYLFFDYWSQVEAEPNVAHRFNQAEFLMKPDAGGSNSNLITQLRLLYQLIWKSIASVGPHSCANATSTVQVAVTLPWSSRWSWLESPRFDLVFFSLSFLLFFSNFILVATESCWRSTGDLRPYAS